MQRIAVFVDAGYLYAEGSKAISGSHRSRSELTLAADVAVDRLCELALDKSKSATLLRVYWYDGMLEDDAVKAEHASIARIDNVKLRLGFVRGGKQKGVDSLIVTDLIGLARNGAISDVLLVSGDEDVRVGVEIAQSLGVRVHLLGLEPRRNSPSAELAKEADTNTELKRDEVSKFLKLVAGDKLDGPIQSSKEETLAYVAAAVVPSLHDEKKRTLINEWKTSPNIPVEIDRQLLGAARSQLGRRLTEDERHVLRDKFKEIVKQDSTSSNPQVRSPG